MDRYHSLLLWSHSCPDCWSKCTISSEPPSSNCQRHIRAVPSAWHHFWHGHWQQQRHHICWHITYDSFQTSKMSKNLRLWRLFDTKQALRIAEEVVLDESESHSGTHCSHARVTVTKNGSAEAVDVTGIDWVTQPHSLTTGDLRGRGQILLRTFSRCHRLRHRIHVLEGSVQHGCTAGHGQWGLARNNVPTLLCSSFHPQGVCIVQFIVIPPRVLGHLSEADGRVLGSQGLHRLFPRLTGANRWRSLEGRKRGQECNLPGREKVITTVSLKISTCLINAYFHQTGSRRSIRWREVDAAHRLRWWGHGSLGGQKRDFGGQNPITLSWIDQVSGEATCGTWRIRDKVLPRRR